MTITTYQNASDFLQENLAFLEVNEVINSLMLGLTFANKALYNDETLYLSIADQETLLCCIKTPGRNAIVYGLDEKKALFIPKLVEYLIQKNIMIPGILGPASPALDMADAWKQKMNVAYEVTLDQLVYRLDKVEPIPSISGHMRVAIAKDLDLLTEWFHLFLIEALNNHNKDEAYQQAKSKIEQQSVFIWEDQHEAVTITAASRPTQHGISINYVYTPSNYRKRGYATALVAAVSQQMLDQGYEFCTLFTDLTNPTSNGIYQKIGYQPISNFKQIEFLKTSS